MKKINREISLLAGEISEKKKRMAVLIITIALFILGAAAPNATIAIGK